MSDEEIIGPEEGDSTNNENDLAFTDLPLAIEVQEAIEAIGYETPSPIQAEAIPYLLEGRDLLGVADTGTGKTAAFGLPILTNLDQKGGGPQALCLTPTRELAIQVAEAMETFGNRIRGFQALPIYGGSDYGKQIRGLKNGAPVVVGTPGRIMDHINKGTLKLDKVKTMVLDEADEMLSMGFIDDIEWILEHMPEERQTALFSATMPAPIRKICEKYMRDPAEVRIKVKTSISPNIRQRYLKRRNPEKPQTLLNILEAEEYDGVLVFAKTKNGTMEIAERLQARGYAAEALNGDLPQNRREKIVNSLKQGRIDVLVATDVAARGLDVERISLVVNYDAPFDVESYVHRIGRTGRAGRSGDAILLLTGKETRLMRSIERVMGGRIDRYEFPSLEDLNQQKVQRFFVRLDEAMKKDFTEYSEVLAKYIEEKEGVDPLQLAAALANMEAGSKPFYLKKALDKPRRERERDNERGRDRGRGNDRGRDRDGGRGRGRDNERGRDRRRGRGIEFEGKEVALKSYRLEVGESHGAGKGDIVGAIANEAGLEARYMGKIRMFDRHSFIDLPEGMPREVFDLLQTVRVRGQSLQISEDKGRRPAGSGKFDRGSRKFDKKPRRRKESFRK
ncbi:MAG: ATP-dependent RNA helicase [Opitutae bacterium]|nr:ATP-dependent RNA helicase [Opitutae bacterium]